MYHNIKITPFIHLLTRCPISPQVLKNNIQVVAITVFERSLPSLISPPTSPGIIDLVIRLLLPPPPPPTTTTPTKVYNDTTSGECHQAPESFVRLVRVESVSSSRRRRRVELDPRQIGTLASLIRQVVVSRCLVSFSSFSSGFPHPSPNPLLRPYCISGNQE